jgi:hypothetical protein
MSLAPSGNAGEKNLSTVSQYRVDKATAETGANMDKQNLEVRRTLNSLELWRKRAVGESIRCSSVMHALFDVRKELEEAKKALTMGDESWADAAVDRAQSLVSEALTRSNHE